MQELEKQERKQILLDTLVAFDRACEELKIKYSVAEGTLIGVVRHKGFIPWDDDIDIYMLRSEYERFIRGYKGQDKRYSVIALENDSKWNRPYAKFYDSYTLEEENTRYNVGIGLGIDLFPLDAVPENVKEFNNYRKKLYLWRDMYVAKSLSLSSRRSAVRNVAIIMMRILLMPFSQRKLAEKVSMLAQKYNGGQRELLCDNVEGYKYREPYQKGEFSSYLQLPFENVSVKVMGGYHEVLTKEYGDYMQLPPEEQRVSHHETKTFWKER